MAEAAYTAKDITVLEGLEPVRLRPGMYVGSTGSAGLHHLVIEVVNNSVDEALADRNDRIEVTLHPDNSVTVRDWGSGIPVDVMADQGLPALTVVLTKLHAGGKFGGEGYKVSGGLHGVGVSVVNALSEWLVAEVRRDGKVYRQEFSRGEPTTDMEVVGRAKSEDYGTTISYLPDAEVFEELDHSAETLQQRLREMAFLTRGLRIVLQDERADGERVEFHYEGGIRDFVAHANAHEDAGAQAHRLLRDPQRGRRRRGRHAVEHLVRGVDLLVRQQHQHALRRLTPVRLPQRAHRDAQPLRARQRPAQGEGGQPRGRGRARGVDGRDLRQAARPAVRGPDEGEAGQPALRGPRALGRQRAALAVPRGEPDGRAPDHPEGDRGAERPSGRPQGARADAPQGRAGELVAARQAGRLPDQRPGGRRALPRRGQLRRRLRRRRARPPLPGDPPAARQGHQLGEEPDQQGALEPRDPGHDHRDRHRTSARTSTSPSCATTGSSS